MSSAELPAETAQIREVPSPAFDQIVDYEAEENAKRNLISRVLHSRVGKITLIAAGVLSLGTTLSLEGLDYAAHRFGDKAGKEAASSALQEVEQKYPSLLNNALDSAQADVQTRASVIVDEVVWQLEKQLNQDVNEDGHIGKPKKQKLHSSSQATAQPKVKRF